MILEKVCKYWYYKVRAGLSRSHIVLKGLLYYAHNQKFRWLFSNLQLLSFLIQARYLNSVTEIPHFEIEPEYALETLMAADFLDSKLVEKFFSI